MKSHYGITERIGEAAALEQLAEEAAELAHAALKMARIVRGENPTPVSKEQAYLSLLEEVGDVRLCVSVLQDTYGTLYTSKSEDEKLERWRFRLDNFNQQSGGVSNERHLHSVQAHNAGRQVLYRHYEAGPRCSLGKR